MDVHGPMVSAFIGVSHARMTALKAQGIPIPPALQIRALIDTGASGTCVDPSVLMPLGLTPTGVVAISTPTTGSAPVFKDQYDVGLLVPPATPTHLPLVIQNLPVVCTDLLLAQGFHALIGRDILSICLMTYDGQAGFFSLAY